MEKCKKKWEEEGKKGKTDQTVGQAGMGFYVTVKKIVK